MRIVCVIPARMGSSRFPGKPLQLIEDIPMVCQVANRVKDIPYVDQVIIATEDNIIYDTVNEYGYESIMTEKHPLGTDRVSEVSREIDCDFVINLQGDEPLMETETLSKFIKESLIKFESRDVYVTNAVTILKPEELRNPNRTKAIVEDDIVKDVSRTELSSWKQLGLYMYRIDAIREYKYLPTQNKFGIDTLRFTENFINVHAIPVETSSLSVDTPDDLKRVRERFFVDSMSRHLSAKK